jgi:hypothetical protein
MCYYLKQNEEPRRATRNIRVYKVVIRLSTNEYQAIVHTEYRYSRGATTPLVTMAVKGDGCTMQWISEGYHFYTSRSVAESDIPMYTIKENYRIRRFIIPKGTLYYKDTKFGIGVAEQITMS